MERRLKKEIMKDAHTGTERIPLTCKEAAGVCILYEGLVCLAKRVYRCAGSGKPVSHGGYWSPFGGAIEKNESPRACAARELKEETQVDVSVTDLCHIKTISNKDGSTYELYGYHAKALEPITLNNEHTEYGYFKIKDLHTSLNPICPLVVKAIQEFYQVK